MGEYALYNGQRIKMGTCENMYYLRADQAHLVKTVSDSLDPIAEAESIRFRFPFPDEDEIKPGQFKDCDRAQGVPGVAAPLDIEHHFVQFNNSKGYYIGLPCPEYTILSKSPLAFQRYGTPEAVRIVQQKALGGHLVLIMECGGCGAKYRLETLAEAQPIVDACRKQSARPGDHWDVIAQRIERGYTEPLPWVQNQKIKEMIASAAEATERFSADELEAYAEQLRAKNGSTP
jgi:hypothetical protein